MSQEPMDHPPSRDFTPLLIESLRDPHEAVEYLNVVMQEGDIDLMLLALRNVAEAQGGLDQAARKIHFSAA